MFEDILNILSNGGHIDYAPISGGVMIFENANTVKPLKIQTFLDLTSFGLIEHTKTMRQGHPIFHGIVDIYKITEDGINIIKV